MADTGSNFEPVSLPDQSPSDTADNVEPAGHFRLYLGAAAGVAKVSTAPNAVP